MSEYETPVSEPGFPEPEPERVEQWVPLAVPVYGERFSDDVIKILNEPIEPSQVYVKPDRGELYMTHIWYRDRLNRAFGQGAWSVRPSSPWIERGGWLVRDWELHINGRYVTECTSGHRFEEGEFGNLSDAREACRSNSYARLCKDLGIAKELWDKQFVERFTREHVVAVAVKTRKKNRNSNQWEDAFVRRMRLRESLPLDGEVGPWRANERGFYPDDAPRVPIDARRFAEYGYTSPEPSAGEGQKPGSTARGASAPPNPRPGASEANHGPNSAASGRSSAPPSPAPAPPAPAPPASTESGTEKLSDTTAGRDRRYVYDSIVQIRKNSDPTFIADYLAAMTSLVLDVKIRSFAQLTPEQARRLREVIDDRSFNVKACSYSPRR